MPNKPISVVLIDPQSLFRNGVRNILGAEPDIDVIGEGKDGRDAIRLVRELTPDVILVTYQIQDMSGEQMLRELRRERSKIVFLAEEEAPEIVLNCMIGDADGYITKGTEDADLAQLVRTASTGKLVMCSQSLAALIEATKTIVQQVGRQTFLSEREREILAMIAADARRADIAQELNISPFTVKNHISKIYRKLGVTSSAAAVNEGHRRKLI